MSKETITLNISGMTCVNCSNAVEKVTKKIKGVEEVHVSFASAKGDFIIDTDLTSKEAVVNKIKKLGYGVANDIAELEVKKKEELALLKQRFFVSLVLTISVMFLDKVALFGTFTLWVIFIAATVVQLYGGGRFYTHAYMALRNKNYDMNVLVALGTTAAFGYSAFVVLFPSLFPEHLRYIYFNGSTVIITFILLGRYLEERSKAKATDFLKKLIDLSPPMAMKLDETGSYREVRVENLGIGDIVVVKAGEKISADGTVIEGEAEIDTSMITGESLPVFKTVGQDVIAGTINQTGYLKIRVNKLAHDSLLANIVTLLGDAQNQKMPIGRFADKVANIFVPTVILIAFVTFCVWYFVGNTLSAILAAISVLIISCPCALGLATPIAIVSAVGKGAKHGILIKNPEVLEVIKDIKYAIFDKTGTLTEGRISVKERAFLSEEHYGKIASLESRSEHPISKAIVADAKENALVFDDEVSEVEILPGRGIKGKVGKDDVMIGNVSFLEEAGVRVSREMVVWMEEVQQQGDGAVIAAIGKESVGCIRLGDVLKPDAQEVIAQLKQEGIVTVMLTGDHESTAQSIAKKLGIDLVYADVLPHEKFKVIQSFQEKAKVLFVGDGINDAPSLKQADIGMALSSGSDIAKDAGDIVLINNELASVRKSITLSIASMRMIKQNLFWAFIYNIIGIPLAAGVLYPIFGLMLTPMYAGMAMSFSSVTVVLNSLRLKFKKL